MNLFQFFPVLFLLPIQPFADTLTLKDGSTIVCNSMRLMPNKGKLLCNGDTILLADVFQEKTDGITYRIFNNEYARIIETGRITLYVGTVINQENYQSFGGGTDYMPTIKRSREKLYSVEDTCILQLNMVSNPPLEAVLRSDAGSWRSYNISRTERVGGYLLIGCGVISFVAASFNPAASRPGLFAAGAILIGGGVTFEIIGRCGAINSIRSFNRNSHLSKIGFKT